MLDILIRWSIWDFKCILSDERKDVHVFMKQLKSDPWFQTEEEEGKMEDSYGQFKILDISNRFKMLDISNRFEIWNFKCILNVEMWLQSCTASNPLSLVWELQQFRTLCASVWSDEKSNLWFQTEVEEGNMEDSYENQRWARMFMRTPYTSNLKVIKVESLTLATTSVHFAEVWSIKEKSMSTVPLPNWWLDRSR